MKCLKDVEIEGARMQANAKVFNAFRKLLTSCLIAENNNIKLLLPLANSATIIFKLFNN